VTIKNGRETKVKNKEMKLWREKNRKKKRGRKMKSGARMQ
jgi:hypothetical protein